MNPRPHAPASSELPAGIDPDRHDVRREIAAAAARLIADTGIDYGSAKHKAAREVLGEGRAPRNAMPDNAQIDEALREHLALFDDEHPARLSRMRDVALTLLQRLSPFHPLATGAVWKGIATEHVPIHLQLFHDNVKEVQFFLIDQRVDFEGLTVPHFRGARHDDEVEAFAFEFMGEPVLLSVYPHDDLRGALLPSGGRKERGDLRALRALIESEGELS